MLDRIAADEIIEAASSGRTRPILMLCDGDSDSPVELFCKLSARCFEDVTNLARELVAALLAGDLGLPVPKPYLVEIPPALADDLAGADIAAQIRASSPVGFGSTKVDNQFSLWHPGSRVTRAMVPIALSTLVFDAVIGNPDRREFNPNCLVSGERIRLIDHELAFPARAMLIDRRPPWEAGSLVWLGRPGGHIFCDQLSNRSRSIDLSPLPGVWSEVTDPRLEAYRAALPPEWNEACGAVDEALDRIRNARDNIDGVIAEIERVLQ